MQVIWAIVTFFVFYSRCNAERDDLQLSDSEDNVEGNFTVEEDGFEGALPPKEFFNSTDENATENGYDEGDKTHVIPNLPYTENTNGEIEVTSQFGAPRKSTNQPVIEENTCGDPPSIEHASVVSGKNSSYGPGAVVTYSCEFGYVADGGIRSARCEHSLQWKQPQIVCIPRSCGDPGFVPDANRIGSVFTFPNSVSFECEEGFKLRGNAIRYCLPSGTWSGKLPSCQKLFCDPPRQIENGQVSFSSLEFGSELRYQCNNGFLLKKHQSRICSANGTWSGDDPVCQDAQCDPPTAPEHGSVQVVGGKSSIDSRAIYTCDGDRVLLGSKTSICMETGEWTFPTPKCLDACSVPEVLHGVIKGYRSSRYRQLPVGTKIINGEKLYLECENNYEPLGKPNNAEQIMCNNGEWRDIPRCEPASCKTPPPATPNARIGTLNNKHAGGIVVYHCLLEYRKTQFGNVSCHFGTWNGITPVCSDTRCYLQTISFQGLVKGKKNVYRNGQSFVPTCESRYTAAIPNNKLTCKNGDWEGHLPPCTAASCPHEPPSIEHGLFKTHSELHGSEVTYECEDGLELVESGSPKIKCLFGEWTGTPPTCKDGRCYLRDLRETHGMRMDDVVTFSGNYLSVSCIDGFTATGANPLCRNGGWTQPNAPCKESPCTVHRVPNGGFTTEEKRKVCNGWGFSCSLKYFYPYVQLSKTIPSSHTLFVTCNSGYTFRGKDQSIERVTCSKGKWIPHPKCLTYGTPYEDESSFDEKTTTKTSATATSRPKTVEMVPVGREDSLHRNQTDELEKLCTCTYENLDDRLVAYSGTELLQSGVKVKNGCKVMFHCTDIGYYRFWGPTEVECKDCRNWHSSEFPQCNSPVRGDPIIQINEQFVLPGGVLAVEEGKSISLKCNANGVGSPPSWETPTTDNIQYSYGYWYAVLDIVEPTSKHNGMYACFLGGRNHSIKIQVISPAPIHCPHIGETATLAVYYENGQTVNSRVSFSCKEKDSKLVGSSVITCLSNGMWSEDLPLCRLPVRCPKLMESEGITIMYSQELNVDSIATFHCFSPRKRIGNVTSKCKMNGLWSDQVPSCLLPNCSLDALFRKIPEKVEPDMKNVSSDLLPYNFTLHLKCIEGWFLHGSETAKCGKDGEWEVSKVQCFQGCAPLPSTNSLIVKPIKNNYRIGELIMLSCPPGEFLSSDVVRVMCLSIGWSEPVIPHCES